MSLVCGLSKTPGSDVPFGVSSRNTCDEQIKSARPPTGDLNGTCYMPIPMISPGYSDFDLAQDSEMILPTIPI